MLQPDQNLLRTHLTNRKWFTFKEEVSPQRNQRLIDWLIRSFNLGKKKQIYQQIINAATNVCFQSCKFKSNLLKSSFKANNNSEYIQDLPPLTSPPFDSRSSMEPKNRRNQGDGRGDKRIKREEWMNPERRQVRGGGRDKGGEGNRNRESGWM